MKHLILALATLTISFAAQAHSDSQICHDSSGSITVEDGNVSIENGAKQLGPAKSQIVLKQISQKDETCVDGPNYESTIVTLEKVEFYKYEEGPASSAVVLCTRNLTGIVGPDTVCK